jgi:hypothetical protein
MDSAKETPYFAALVFYETPERYYTQACDREEAVSVSHAEYLAMVRAICQTFENNEIEVYLVDFDPQAYHAWKRREHRRVSDTTALRTEWAYQVIRSPRKVPELVVQRWRKRLGVLPG